MRARRRRPCPPRSRTRPRRSRRCRARAAARALRISARAGSSSISPARHHAAADDDQLGVEDVHVARDRDAEPRPDQLEHRAGGGVAVVGQLGHQRPVELAAVARARARAPSPAARRRSGAPRARAPCRTPSPRSSRGWGSCPGTAGRPCRSPCGPARRPTPIQPRYSSPSRIRPPAIPVPSPYQHACDRRRRAAPARCSASAATLPSLSTNTGSPGAPPSARRSGYSSSGRLTATPTCRCDGRSATGFRSRPHRPRPAPC